MSYLKQQQADKISYLEEALKRQVCFAEYKQHSFSGPGLFSSPHPQRACLPQAAWCWTQIDFPLEIPKHWQLDEAQQTNPRLRTYLDFKTEPQECNNV